MTRKKSVPVQDRCNHHRPNYIELTTSAILLHYFQVLWFSQLNPWKQNPRHAPLWLSSYPSFIGFFCSQASGLPLQGSHEDAIQAQDCLETLQTRSLERKFPSGTLMMVLLTQRIFSSLHRISQINCFHKNNAHTNT